MMKAAVHNKEMFAPKPQMAALDSGVTGAERRETQRHRLRWPLKMGQKRHQPIWAARLRPQTLRPGFNLTHAK